MAPTRLLTAALLLTACSAAAPATTTVLVTGASGQTGSILYKLLRATPGYTVRAMVRNTTKARAALGCDKCDPSEGIYTGDVTNVTTLAAAFAVRQRGEIPTCSVALRHYERPRTHGSTRSSMCVSFWCCWY